MSMKPEEKILKAFGDIDEKYINEAAPLFETGSTQVTQATQATQVKGDRRRVRTYNRIIRFAGTAAAAVIVLIAAAGVLSFVRTGSDSAPLTQQSVTTGSDSAFSKISQEEAFTEEYALEEAAPAGAAGAFTAEVAEEEESPAETAGTFSAESSSEEAAPAAGAAATFVEEKQDENRNASADYGDYAPAGSNEGNDELSGSEDIADAAMIEATEAEAESETIAETDAATEASAGTEAETEAATEEAALKLDSSQESLDSGSGTDSTGVDSTGIAGVNRYDSLSEAETAAGIRWDRLNPAFKADVQEITEEKAADHYMALPEKMLGICFVNDKTSDYTEVYAERTPERTDNDSVIESIMRDRMAGGTESIVRTDDHGMAVIRENPADGMYAVQWNDGEFVYLTISRSIPEWVRQYFGN